MTDTRTLEIWRGGPDGGERVAYEIEAEPGMVVLDAVLEVQRTQAQDLAVRWNCKAAKCGSCSAEINGRPRLMCKTRLDHLPEETPITVEPIKAFPPIRDLVTDVSWNYKVNERIPPFTPAPDAEWSIAQEDVDRMSEFRKCIECFLCQDVCHVLREHRLHSQYFGPRFLVRLASLEMHPLDTLDRIDMIKDEAGVGLCNITKCCTEVCPAEIHITDNAIIPLKERVVDRHYDPVMMVVRKVTGRDRRARNDSPVDEHAARGPVGPAWPEDSEKPVPGPGDQPVG
jgi:succinate dehydrogenase / fumarate reductase iron-sulfur subunit